MIQKRPLWTRLFTNMPYKFLAVAIACVIWYVVQSEEILEISRRLDITFEVPQGLAMRESRNISRDVTLRGPRAALSDFSSKPIEAIIRLPIGKKGAQRYRLDKDMIPHWDNRIKITVHDPYVTIFVDDRASRSVPIKVAMVGSPKSGVAIQDIRTEPTEVTVTGLKSEVQKLQELSTEVIDIGGLSEAKSFPVPLSMSGLPAFDLSTQQVVVHVSIVEGTMTKYFESVAIEVIGTDKISSTQPHHVSVAIQGPSDIMSRVNSRDVQAFLDAKNLPPGRFEKDITVKAPAGVTITNVVPKRAAVEVYNQRKLH